MKSTLLILTAAIIGTSSAVDLSSLLNPDDTELAGFSKSTKSRPQILLPTAILNPDGSPKPANQLPPELQPDKDAESVENSASRSSEPQTIYQRRPAGVYSDPAGLYEVTEPPKVAATEEPKESNADAEIKDKDKNSDIILELNPDAEDLEFRHENSTYKQTTPLPNFSAKIYTLSYAGIQKPVLIIQPDVRSSQSNNGPQNGNKDGVPETGANIPTFSIHFPLQSSSQFQIPKFNFTLPTLFLPGLVFTQNENVEKNTHEIHVSIPQSSHTYEAFPTSHIPAELELLLQAPNLNDFHHHHDERPYQQQQQQQQEQLQQYLDNFPPPHQDPHVAAQPLPEKYDENQHEAEPPKHYKPEPREPEQVVSTSKFTTQGTSNAFGHKLATEWQPLGTYPLKGQGLDRLAEIRKGSIGAFHNKVNSQQPEPQQQKVINTQAPHYPANPTNDYPYSKPHYHSHADEEHEKVPQMIHYPAAPGGYSYPQPHYHSDPDPPKMPHTHQYPSEPDPQKMPHTHQYSSAPSSGYTHAQPQHHNAVVIKDEPDYNPFHDLPIPPHALPNEMDKARPSNDHKVLGPQGSPGPVQIVPLSELRPLNAIQTLLSPLNSLAPNISINHPKWQLPTISEIYSKLFGVGRNEDGCLGRHEPIDTPDPGMDEDPSLCGSDGLCGVTCHRLGFYLGKCVDESSCVCLLKSRPEFGLKLEYYVDKRARSQQEAFPAFGLCHLAACRLNCERSGFLTGVCDNTCLCGSPWAEKKRK